MVTKSFCYNSEVSKPVFDQHRTSVNISCSCVENGANQQTRRRITEKI